MRKSVFNKQKKLNFQENTDEFLLNGIQDSLYHSRRLFLLYISVAFYIVISIISTQDRQIILNEGIKLPIVNIEVSFSIFFIFTPIIVIIIYTYFMLYVEESFRLIIRYKEKKLQEFDKDKIYPWLFIKVLLNPRDKFFSGILAKILIQISAFLILPMVLALYYFFGFRIESSFYNFYTAFIVLIGFALSFTFFLKCVNFFRIIVNDNYSKIRNEFIASIIIVVAFISISLLSTEVRNKIYKQEIDLSYQVLVKKPEVDYKGVFWADLNGINLTKSNLTSCVLKRADLRTVILDNSNLSASNLQEANLSNSSIKHSNFNYSILIKSIINNTKFSFTTLVATNLSETDFSNSEFFKTIFEKNEAKKTKFISTSMDSVDFSEVNLQNPIFNNSKISSSNFKNTEFIEPSFQSVIFSNSKFTSVKFEGANCEKTIFINSILKDVNFYRIGLSNSKFINDSLVGCSFNESFLKNVEFSNSIIIDCDFRKTKKLSLDNLYKAKLIVNSKFDETTLELIKKEQPDILLYE